MYNYYEYLTPISEGADSANVDETIEVIDKALSVLSNQANSEVKKTKSTDAKYWYYKGMVDVLKVVRDSLSEAQK